MRKVKKTLLAVACAGALVVGSVAATMAYLTDDDSVVNTFTVGNVDIELDEALVNGNGEAVDESGAVVADPADAERVKGNAYHLIPGADYVKDPTVTVLAGSEESYVRMLVTVSDIEALKEAFGPTYMSGDVFLLEKIVEGWDRNKWAVADYSENTVTVGDGADAKQVTNGVYEFRYCVKVDGFDGDTKASEKLPPLFTSIVIPGDEIDNGELAMLDGVNVTVQAHAIQAAGFIDANAAWEKF